MSELLRAGMIVVLCAACVFGQTPSKAVTAAAATPPKGPAATRPILFETVSIRPVKSDRMYGAGFTADGYLMHGITAYALLTYYTLKTGDTLDGAPGWTEDAHYDVAAKIADSDVARWSRLSLDQRCAAIYALLAERFKLVIHTDVRTARGFALVVKPKTSLKLKRAIAGDTYPGGLRDVDGTAMHGATLNLHGDIQGQAATMADLAQMLQCCTPDHGPVRDATGITGRFDFVIPTGQIFRSLRPNPDGTPPEFAGPSIFMLLSDVGLKLEKGTVPSTHFVIDHIERPSEN